MADRKLKLGEAGPFKFDETLFTAAMPGLNAWEPLASERSNAMPRRMTPSASSSASGSTS